MVNYEEEEEYEARVAEMNKKLAKREKKETELKTYHRRVNHRERLIKGIVISLAVVLMIIVFFVGRATAYVPSESTTYGHNKTLTKTTPVNLARWNDTTLAAPKYAESIYWKPVTSSRPATIIFQYQLERGQKKFCYIIDDGWYRWCESWDKDKEWPTLAMYNGRGYKMFDLAWLELQMYGSRTQYDNANKWVMKIMNAKRK